jgi:hypothetical protein
MSLPTPSKCTKCGTYNCSIPMPLNGRVHDIDYCVAGLVAALNAGGIATSISCCGHGELPGTIVLSDGRLMTIRTAPGNFAAKGDET